MKYAYLNPHDSNRIVQWIDTDLMDYVLPEPSLLHECSADEWELQHKGEMMVGVAGVEPYHCAPVVPSRAEEARLYSEAIQKHLDGAAVSRGYDDIKTAVTYAEEPSVPKFQSDGKAFRAWRSKVWEYAYAQLDLVESGKRDKPSVDQLLAELPLLSGV